MDFGRRTFPCSKTCKDHGHDPQVKEPSQVLISPEQAL